MNENYFDVIVLGTGLAESILAAALAKAGFKLAHIDVNAYYGADEASLSLDELVQWVDGKRSTAGTQARYVHATRSRGDVPSQSRYYSMSLCPSVIPSTGPIISSLIASGVSKYGGFRLVDFVAIYDGASGTVKSVPGSKEDVFKSKDISLVDKRRIMRFLVFASSDFEDKAELEGKHDVPFLEFLKTVFALNDDVSMAIAYALAYCIYPSGKWFGKLRCRYGPSPFLVGHYGGAGEIAQGFCRAAAVNGSIYILGRQVLSITAPDPETDDSPYTVLVDDVPDPLFCKLLISSSNMTTVLPPNSRWLMPHAGDGDDSASLSVARCIAVIDFPISFSPAPHNLNKEETQVEEEEKEPVENGKRAIDTGIIVFPPCSLLGGSTSMTGTVFITGEGSMTSPKGKSVVYIALPLEPENKGSDPETTLKPYLEAMLSLALRPVGGEPLFTAFYIEEPCSKPSTETSDMRNTCLVTTPVHNCRLADAPDAAAVYAEELFWQVVQVLRPNSSESGPEEGVIDSFWPSATEQGEDVDEEW
ncbi:hypothetical protein AX17_000940 [Amanita inopinata Kibby_2008]|nr:hypothetical protein AX17_000940 [Amanita inopinata Kibby_2008]